MMQSSTIQADIKDLIKNDICASFSSIKDACVKYVDQYSQIVFEFLVTELDPATRCSSLGLCTSDSNQQDRVLHFQSHSLDGATSSSNSAECILCEEVVGELEKMLENNKTEEAIEKALDAVCDILPSKIRKSCEDFVNTYTPAIIIILQSEVSPGEVCTLLGLCSSARANTKNTPLITGNDETCLLCETVMQYVEALVEENATVSEIEAIVKKICNFLPDTVKDECNAIIDQYADEIVQYIVAKYTPKQICILIKLCTEEPESNGIKMADLTKPQQRPLVGKNKCTYGPAYWCATPGNADECQATEHCQKYVWKN
jgi:saposin